MDKRRIAAMLPAVSARVPVAARGEAVDSRGGKDCCSKDAVGRPVRALLPAREPSLRAIRNDSTLPRLAVHAGARLRRSKGEQD
jgi:hypothetical protein